MMGLVCVREGNRLLAIETDTLKRWAQMRRTHRMMFRLWIWMKYRMPRVGRWGPYAFNIPGTNRLWRWAVDHIDDWWSQ